MHFNTTPEHAGYGPRIFLPELSESLSDDQRYLVFKMLDKMSKWGGSDYRGAGVDSDILGWEFTTANAHVAVAALEAMGFTHKPLYKEG